MWWLLDTIWNWNFRSQIHILTLKENNAQCVLQTFLYTNIFSPKNKCCNLEWLVQEPYKLPPTIKQCICQTMLCLLCMFIWNWGSPIELQWAPDKIAMPILFGICVTSIETNKQSQVRQPPRRTYQSQLN